MTFPLDETSFVCKAESRQEYTASSLPLCHAARSFAEHPTLDGSGLLESFGQNRYDIHKLLGMCILAEDPNVDAR
jgi:hypothetical protein